MRHSHPRVGAQLAIYLELLSGAPGPVRKLVELRWLTASGGMHRAFLPAREHARLARRIFAVARSSDVFVGVAQRDIPHGGRGAISGGHLLYADCDEACVSRSRDVLPLPPTLEVASGTPGHLHAYWRLEERITPPEVEHANRRLALALNADPACIDAARILRPPETLNYKTWPPRPVLISAHRPHARYRLAEILAQLPEQDTTPLPAASHKRRSSRGSLERRLLAIPAGEYTRVLSGREPNLAGKILCPFHHERNPSLQLYPDGTFYCYGRRNLSQPCAKGGSIFDFAAALWGLGTRGADFLELRRRLAWTFALESSNDKD